MIQELNQEDKRMKRALCLVLALVLMLSASIALADAKTIDPKAKRNIKINKAGLNPSAEEMIDQGISPTTGRKLADLPPVDNFSGIVMTGKYQPVMVQISNASNGFNDEGGSTTDTYKNAPVNGNYADVVYECIQASGGGLSRMSMVFADYIPDYVGYVRSTRYTHARLRQEWDCNFLTSGYLPYMLDEWKAMKVPNPMSGQRGKDPGPVYVGGVSDTKPWRKYYFALRGIADANNKLYQAANLVNDVVPKDYKYANHTWLFSEELPEGGDDGEIIYITMGSEHKTDSRLEYDADNNVYHRYCNVVNVGDKVYRATKLSNIEFDKKAKDVIRADREPGEEITFSNVIVQGITMNWKGSEKPDPKLTGSGIADYFLGGKHYEGVWEREKMNDRTVFYGPDGNEIKLQPGKTLIVLAPYNEKYVKVQYE